MIGTLAGLAFFIIIILACCASSGDSSKTPAQKTNSKPKPRRTVYYDDDGYCECPSCGNPYYDGYCDECGYPDVNQGWLGEQY